MECCRQSFPDKIEQVENGLAGDQQDQSGRPPAACQATLHRFQACRLTLSRLKARDCICWGELEISSARRSWGFSLSHSSMNAIRANCRQLAKWRLAVACRFPQAPGSPRQYRQSGEFQEAQAPVAGSLPRVSIAARAPRAVLEQERCRLARSCAAKCGKPLRISAARISRNGASLAMVKTCKRLLCMALTLAQGGFSKPYSRFGCSHMEPPAIMGDTIEARPLQWPCPTSTFMENLAAARLWNRRGCTR